jgi:mono/diheme cytochrome c family protein
VAHLNDANGWWRDTAQQLLVLKQDKAVVPALSAMARTSSNQLARIHSLWTLEGLSAANAALVREMLKDADPQIRIQAIRVSETLYKAGDKSFAADWTALTKDTDVDVVMQAMMTMNTLKASGANAAIQAAADASKARGVQLVARTILTPEAPATGINASNLMEAITPYTAEEQQQIDKGKETYNELCFTCHGQDGRGEPVPGAAPGTTKAPPLASSPRVLGHRDYVVNALLFGLTGPLNGTNYSEVMIPMGQQTDDWIASVASYVRNAFGNRAPLVTAADVARIRAANASRKTSWVPAALEASLPKPLVESTDWKLTASHNSATARNALSIAPWSSGAPQQAGMWLQVELPQATTVTELQFESAVVPAENVSAVPGAPTRTAIPAGLGGRGGRGGAPGAAGAAPAPPAAPTPPASPGYPRGYQVQVSMDGVTWGSPVAQGQGAGTLTDIRFAPVRAKFIRITQTATLADAPPWSVQRLRLYEPGMTVAAPVAAR